MADTAVLTFSAFEKMGIDVYGIGSFDLIFGTEFLKNQLIGKSMQFVSANLLEKQSGKPYFKPYVLHNKNGKKILVSQVFLPNSELLIENFFLADPIKTLTDIRDKISHDFFIVILYASPRDSQQYLKKLNGVNVVILGGQNGQLTKKNFVNETLLLCNNNEGKTISFIDIMFPSKDKKNVAKEIVFDGPFTEEVKMETVKEDMDISKMIADYKYKTGLYRPQNPDKTIQYAENFRYVGKDWCIKCHKDIVASWEKTGHAHAMETLVKAGKHEEKSCLPCHVTGAIINDAKNVKDEWIGGFISMGFTPHMANVQCESCHGMADGHISKPSARYIQNINLETCVVCHTPERDPDFNFENDLEKVKH